MGRGYPISHSAKQKLNTRSSCEGETVAVDDLMPQILWTRLFLEAQGYGTRESIIYQDNLQCWVRQHHDQTIMINQAAGMVRCQGIMKNKVDVLIQKLTSDLQDFDLPDKVTDWLEAISTACEFSTG